MIGGVLDGGHLPLLWIAAPLAVAALGLVVSRPRRAVKFNARLEWSGLVQADWDLRTAEHALTRGDHAAAAAVLVDLGRRTAGGRDRVPPRLDRLNKSAGERVSKLQQTSTDEEAVEGLAAAVAGTRADVEELKASIVAEGKRANRRRWAGRLLIAIGLAMIIVEAALMT